MAFSQSLQSLTVSRLHKSSSPAGFSSLSSSNSLSFRFSPSFINRKTPLLSIRSASVEGTTFLHFLLLVFRDYVGQSQYRSGKWSIVLLIEFYESLCKVSVLCERIALVILGFWCGLSCWYWSAIVWLWLMKGQLQMVEFIEKITILKPWDRKLCLVV